MAQSTSIPKNFKWTAEDATKAQANAKFIRVGGNNLGKRSMTGAVKTWSKGNPDYIYLPDSRLVGAPADVAQALRYAGFSEAEIQEQFNNAITASNYQSTKRDAYEQEYARASAASSKEKKSKKTETFELEDILRVGDYIDQGKVTVVTKEKIKAKRTGKSKEGDQGKSIANAYVKLFDAKNAGKVLDVSKFDATTGGGWRTIKTPDVSSSRVTKFGADDENVRIVSDNAATYAAALRAVYSEADLTDDQIRILADRVAEKVSARANKPAKATGAKRVGKGGVKAPGASIAKKATIKPVAPRPRVSPLKTTGL